MKFLRKNIYFALTCVASFILFSPSLFKFFTNDDFFYLKIAHISSLKDFLNFFNIVKDVESIGVYRPLTLRVYYFLTVEFFHLNPMPLHIISFATFFIDIFLVGVLIKLLTKNYKIALISSFLYAVSSTHFGQLYYIGAFQELLLTLLFLASVIFFIKYETDVKVKRSINNIIISFLFFILSLMSKETAVVLPFVLVLIHFYLKLTKRVETSVKTLIYSLLPYIIILGAYLFVHFRYYGLVTGDSYVWNFSPFKALNTLTWYGLWSLNIPEMLVDFVGPGLRLNPNLLKYWSKEVIPIFVLFVIQIFAIFGLLFKSFKIGKNTNKGWILISFSILWFIVTLVPVLFLPIHKFSYYLTLPLIGVVLVLSYLLEEAKISKVGIGLFLIAWTATSVLTLRLTYQTNWITQSETLTYKVYQYFNTNEMNLSGKNIYFVDTKNDSNLPWSPTQTVKTALSDKNFFDVFYADLSAKVNYAGLIQIANSRDAQIIESRQFLGY